MSLRRLATDAQVAVYRTNGQMNIQAEINRLTDGHTLILKALMILRSR